MGHQHNREYGRGCDIINNADKIKAMTDEELAYYIAMFMDCDECILKDEGSCVDVITCQTAWLDWLKQEVQDGQE